MEIWGPRKERRTKRGFLGGKKSGPREEEKDDRRLRKMLIITGGKKLESEASPGDEEDK